MRQPVNLGVLVLGIDSGFAEMGYAFVRLTPEERVIDLGAFQTKKDPRKQRVLCSDDEFRRAREIARYLDELLVRHGRPAVVCFEAQSYPRNSATVRKMALAWGAAAAVIELRSVADSHASPQAIKTTLCGVANASKKDVRAALERRYGEPLKRLLSPLSTKLAAHSCDALGSIVACSDGPEVRMARGLLSHSKLQLPRVGGVI
jgi:Holliday junction resolvasome RuvABC endonuclease subunit